jgi:hypothetical protein
LLMDPAQQVEVLLSFVTDCKKPLHQNRWWWWVRMHNFKV